MKAMNRKSLGVLALCALLAGSLTACGNGKVGSDVSSAVSKAGNAISSTASKAGSKLEEAMDPDSSSRADSSMGSTKDISSRPDSEAAE